MQAARGADALARHPGRVVRGEKYHDWSHFLRPAEACAERRRRGCFLAVRAPDKANPPIALGVNHLARPVHDRGLRICIELPYDDVHGLGTKPVIRVKDR